VKNLYGKPFGIKTHRNKGFSTTQNIVIFKVLFTEYTTFKSRKELFLANSEYKQNVIYIPSKKLVEEGCSTIQASDMMQMS